MSWNFSSSITGRWYLWFSALPAKHAIYLAAWVNKYVRFDSVTAPTGWFWSAVCHRRAHFNTQTENVLKEEKEDGKIRKGWRGKSPVCGLEWPLRQCKGIFWWLQLNERANKTQGREEMRGGRKEAAGSKGLKQRDFIRTYWLQAASVASLPPWLKAHRRGGGRGRCLLWAFFFFS